MELLRQRGRRENLKKITVFEGAEETLETQKESSRIPMDRGKKGKDRVSDETKPESGRERRERWTHRYTQDQHPVRET